MQRALHSSVLAAFLAGCSAPTPPPPEEAPRPVTTLAVYSIDAGGRAVGTLKRLAIEDRRGPIRIWRIENLDRQYLGFADAEGRFFRHLPFEERETFVGMYPMNQGLKVLLETEAEVTTKALEADFKKGGAAPEFGR